MKTVILVSLLVSLVRAKEPAVPVVPFAFDETLSCPDGQFRSLDGEAQLCKVCYKPTFRAAYGVATDLAPDNLHYHTKCCANPDQHVCQVMKAEYEANCPCAADNDHCFNPNGWQPAGVNVIHLDLTLLEDPNTFQYTAAAGEDQRSFADWQALNYTIDGEFETSVSFTSIIPGGPEVPYKELTIADQQLKIDCTEPDLAPWCASTTKSCTRATALIIQTTLRHPTADTDWYFALTGSILNRDGEAGDVELLVVDYAESQYQWNTNLDVTQHDQWERDNDLTQCITREGEICPVIAGTSRRRLIGHRHGC